MSENYPIPEPEKVERTVVKLRQIRREIEEFGLELAAINARLEANIREQRLRRLQKKSL